MEISKDKPFNEGWANRLLREIEATCKREDIGIYTFAREAGVAPQTFYHYTKGRLPSAEAFAKLSVRCGLSPNEIMGIPMSEGGAEKEVREVRRALEESLANLST